LTCWQFGNNTETANGSKLTVAGDSSSPCDAMLYRPVRFSLGTDPEDLWCTWSTNSNVGRFFLTLIATLWPIIGVWAILKRKRMVSWLFSIVSILGTLGWFLMMCSDANDVRISSSWCNSGLEGIQLSPPGTEPHCNYINYVGTCLGEAGNFLLWLASSILTIRYLRKSA